ncbi:MAG: 3-phosphoshikimate 1-carboxyvinyltransferase, partial [Hyphococcus sp.]
MATSDTIMPRLNGPLRARASTGIAGAAEAPGDKSISHRALIFSALAHGESRIEGLLESDDVLRTGAAMRALGAGIEKDGAAWRVVGGNWRSPDHTLYFGNAGTGARLAIGAVAGRGVRAGFDGDASLRARPMGRILEPLRLMGLEALDAGGRLPVIIEGDARLKSIKCRLSAPSAQVKSAILLAGLGAEGVTQIHEPALSRDHTERMLGAFGVALDFEKDGETGRFIRLAGGQALQPANVVVPGDPSSAAFLVAAALITPSSDALVKNVLVNPL